jgi:G3E family GTPase
MVPVSSIPFHIISGFLGSGKTTFLKYIIEHLPGDLKTGIIQNEFAPVSVDGTELKSSGKNFELLEINNGSVFCVCLLNDFISSLNSFIGQYQPDLIILEASGLSDTTSVAEVLAHPLLSGKIHLASNWCIVDAVNFLHAGKMQQRINHQIRMADRILINKADLAPEAVPEISACLKTINPFAHLSVTTHCRADFLSEALPVPRFMPAPGHPLPRPEVNSMVIKTVKIMPEYRLEDFLRKWGPLSYRIKGFARVESAKTVAVQCTPRETGIRQVPFWAGPTELIALTDQFTLHEWNRSFREFSGKG